MARDSTETIEYSIVFHMYLCNIWEWLNDWLFLCITKYRSKNFRNESPLTKQKSFDKAESGILTYFFSNLPIIFFYLGEKIVRIIPLFQIKRSQLWYKARRRLAVVRNWALKVTLVSTSPAWTLTCVKDYWHEQKWQRLLAFMQKFLKC